MKKKIRGLKRATFELDFDLYRVKVPISNNPGFHLSVIDLSPESVDQTIVFQHGFAGVAESFEYQLTHFSSQFRVVAPDLRGHGQSDAPYTDYTMDELVEDLITIVDALDLPEKFILAGHSFGGSVCVEFANAYPERIEKLILLATAGEYPVPKAASLLSRVPINIIRPVWRYRPKWDAELHVMKRMFVNNLMKWQGWSKLKNLTMDTLVITGERDNYFPRSVFDDVAKMIPHADVYDVGSAKHKVQLERSTAVNRAIERFIDNTQYASWRDQTDKDSLIKRRPWLRSYDKDTPHTIPIPKQPLYRFLESAADWQPNQTASVFYGKTYTYRELNEKVNQFARALRRMDINVGDRVIVVLPNTPQFIIAYYGILKAGGVVVLSNPDATIDLIVQQAIETSAKLLVTLSVFSELAEVMQQKTTAKTTIFTSIDKHLSNHIYTSLLQAPSPFADDVDTPARRIGRFMSEVMSEELTTSPIIPVDPDQLAIITYTSGTTSRPKGVCLTHHNLVANALQTRHWLPDIQYGKETVIAAVPFMHSYGMTAAMNVPITVAATIVIVSVFELEQLLELIKKHKPTLFPGVPSMYTAINQTNNVRNYGVSSIKACISGAAPLPVEVQEAFEKLTHGRLVEGYGLTEASPVTHSNPLFGLRKVGSIGIPIPNTDAKIVDLITGEDVGVGQIGELVVRGPQVMQGYWQSDDEDESIIVDGWLFTGDVAIMDDDGYFKIISRKRDTIFTGDFSVYPRDVEEVLYENNKVLEVAVVGIGHESGRQKVKAFVVPRPNSTLSKDELIELCKHRLAEYAVPWEIEFRETLPKSFVGKVLRRLLYEEPKI